MTEETKNKNYRKEFCKEVLQIYYDLSGGSSVVLVFRQQVAEHLGIEDRDEFKLLSTVIYLEEKYYLKIADNTREQITALGIDEVENGFPNLLPSCSVPQGSEDTEEILELKPGYFGITLNLKALWRRVYSLFRKS